MGDEVARLNETIIRWNIGQALANEREAGRKEGLEEAAKLIKARGYSDSIVAHDEHGHPLNVISAARLEVRKAIRERYGLNDEQGEDHR